MTLLPDQLNITFQNGSWTDRRTQEVDFIHNWSPMELIPLLEKILKDLESASNIEVSDITGDSESEVRELSLQVDVERLSVLQERRSEQSKLTRSSS